MNKVQLMESVKVKKFLYDHNEKDYKDQSMKDLAWAEIAKACGAKNAKQAKAEWKKIRDNFRDAVKRYNIKDSERGKTLEDYVYYEQMNFLLPYITVRDKNPDSNVSETGILSWSTEDSLDSDSEDQDTKEEPPRKKAKEEILTKPTPEEESVDSFFKAMANSTKLMPQRYQVLVKNDVFNVVYEYEEEILDNGVYQ